MFAFPLVLDIALAGGSVGRHKIVSDVGWAADLHTKKIPGLRRRVLPVLAVEPSEVHARILGGDLEDHLAAGLELIVQRKRPNPVRIVAIIAGAPHQAANSAARSAGKVAVGAEAE